MMRDEDFKQTVLDYFSIAQQRYRDMMTSNQDVMNAISALPISGLSDALTQLSTTVNTAIADMGTGGDAARAGFVTALTAAGTQLTAVAAQINTIETNLTAAIAAVTTAAAATPAA